MEGDNLCGECGAEMESMDDCFTGEARHIDNFGAVEADLRDRGVVSDDDPLLGDLTEEERAALEAEGIDVDREGPFIAESIVCRESWCPDCGHSERVWQSPDDVAAALAAALTGGD